MTKKMSVVATNSMRFGAIIVFLFVMVMLNLLSDKSCTKLRTQRGAMECELERLEDSYMRTSTRWEEMKTTESIDAALLRHGLSMRTPRPDQTVRLLPDGTPRPGQLSIAKSKMRMGAGPVAANASSPRRRRHLP